MIYPKLEILQTRRTTVFVCFLLLMMVMAVAPTAGTTRAGLVNAQKINPADQLYSKNFVVYVTLYGLNSTKGQVLAFINAHGMVKSVLLNATKLDMMDNKTDGIGQIYFMLPNVTMNAGESYSACVVILNAAKMVCSTDFKSPNPRPQYLDLSIQ